MRCGVWPTPRGACGAPSVERLAFLNPNCGGGDLDVCPAHLAEYLRGSLLPTSLPEEGER